MKIDHHKLIPTVAKISIAAAVVLILALFIVFAWFTGCDNTETPPREDPIVFWIYQTPVGVPDPESVNAREVSRSYIPQGDVMTFPAQWQLLAFKVPKRGVTVPYVFQWAPPGELWETLAVITVDSLSSGVVLVAAKGIRSGDQVRLNLPWEGYQ